MSSSSAEQRVRESVPVPGANVNVEDLDFDKMLDEVAEADEAGGGGDEEEEDDDM